MPYVRRAVPASSASPLVRPVVGDHLAVGGHDVLVRAVQPIDRPVRAEHAAIGSECLDAGEDPRPDARHGPRRVGRTGDRRDLADDVRPGAESPRRHRPGGPFCVGPFERQAGMAEHEHEARPTGGDLVEHVERVIVPAGLERAPRGREDVERRCRVVGVEVLRRCDVADTDEAFVARMPGEERRCVRIGHDTTSDDRARQPVPVGHALEPSGFDSEVGDLVHRLDVHEADHARARVSAWNSGTV